MLSFEISEISKNTIFTDHLQCLLMDLDYSDLDTSGDNNTSYHHDLDVDDRDYDMVIY